MININILKKYANMNFLKKVSYFLLILRFVTHAHT